jgi:hypothetical protein
MSGLGGVQQEKLHKIRKDSSHYVSSEIIDRGHELRRFVDHFNHHPKAIRIPASLRIFIGDGCESALKLNFSLPASG